MEFTRDARWGSAASERNPRRALALACAAGVVALVISAMAFGIAIQRRAVAPPEGNIRLGAFRIAAFTTNDPACARYLLCPPDHFAASAQDYYAIWVLNRTGQPDPSGGVIEVGQPVLMLTLDDKR